MKVICVISVIFLVVVVVALDIFLLFHFIIFRYFFLEKCCPTCDEDCPVAVKKCRNRECDYTFKKKKKDWERVKKRGVISPRHEREKLEYRVGIYIVEIH